MRSYFHGRLLSFRPPWLRAVVPSFYCSIRSSINSIITNNVFVHHGEEQLSLAFIAASIIYSIITNNVIMSSVCYTLNKPISAPALWQQVG